ncbi:GNAT family N-acetyltransferase [Longispora sp. NPDC051575]|uniref:GNAT family N-acetyltransferase n=1 Tax=Longispora sp. NPDC051575 TaxID=3154943 RepID=UPI003413ABDF
MITVRRFRPADAPTVWALNNVPPLGATADDSVPLALPPESTPPVAFPDLGDIAGSFLEFLVVETDGHLVGMGGLKPRSDTHAEVLRVRVHPAVRRRGVGRALLAALEDRAAELGFRGMFLDTTTNQPEVVAFYRGLGYTEAGRSTFPHWTLVYFTKEL